MSNEQKFIITVRYPEWQQEDFVDPNKVQKYPSFGVRYFFTTGLVIEPDWDEDDERWFSWSEESVIAERFVEWYELKIGGEFKGEILFIDPTDLVIADGVSTPSPQPKETE